MKAILGVACLVCLITDPGLSQGGGGEATVVHSDERSLVIEYTPRFLPLETIRKGNTEMKLLDFEGSMPRWSKEKIGSPDLRGKVFPIGFPAETGNAVQVISADYEDISNVVLAPVPTVHFGNDMDENREYKIDPGKYSAVSFVPAQSAELSGPGRAQTLWVGSVIVYPVQYNPTTRILRKYTRLVIEVVYGRSNEMRVRNMDDRIFDGVLLNYNVARNWTFAPPRPLARVSTVPGLLSSGDWYRIPISEEGIYVLTPAFLRSLGINTATLDPRTVKIFGNGGKELPENIQESRPADLVENAIYVEGEGDGRLDEGDYVMFFAKSVRSWTYNASSHTMSHYIHHYTEENCYWLTFSGSNGKRMPALASLTENPVRTPTQFLDAVCTEQENVNINKSGKDWFGREYDAGANFTYVTPLPGLVHDDVIKYTVRLLGLSGSPYQSPSFSVSEGSTALGEWDPGYWNGGAPSAFIVNTSASSSIDDNTSRLHLAFQHDYIGPKGWDDWVEIRYPRRLDGVSNVLRFRSPDDVTGVVQYDLGQFTSIPTILDVTVPDNVRRLTGLTGNYSFRALETAGQVSEYCAASAAVFKQPHGVVKVENQNLHGDTTDVDFIIVTSQEFRSAANRLKQRREQPEHGGLATRVVDVAQIYNEFGGGLPDVTAIRDYLKHEYDIWLQREHRQSAFFVLFLGQGSYDYKGLLGSRSSYVPTWQTSESLWGLEAYPTDDFFSIFGTSGVSVPSIVTGRVNARTPDEADGYVTKLIHYEDASARDSWKMRMIFVGDDQYGEDGTGSEGTMHSQAAEDLATQHTPPEFEKRKIYIAEYPTIQNPQGRRKPAAFQAIIDQINDGALLTNYTGHGNPQVWAHENVFNVETSIPQLVNNDRLSLFFVATCSFSQFDDPDRRTGSEILVNKPDGGAIAAIGASRLAEAGANSSLHNGTFDRMFRHVGRRLIVERPSTALYLYKLLKPGGADGNDQKYFYMGDPTMKLAYPEGYVAIDSINHQPLSGVTQQLKALARVSVQGTVRDAADLPDTSFNGRVLLTVNDASRHDTIADFPTATGRNWAYLAAGGTIYRGQNSIARGRFSARFVVPKDILYADSTSFGRIAVYSLNASQSSEGSGFRDSIRVGGTEIAPPDTSGPGMTLYLDTRSFRPGDMVSGEPTLLVDLVDSNGINTSVSGIGHRIEAWVNASPQSKDITEYYTSQLDDFQRGTATYKLNDLRQGKNTVRVRAWDTHNNPAVGETFFEVASSDQLRISEIFNYPNPFANGTTFTFKQNMLTPITVKVKIYTVAGRLIQSLETVSSGEPFVRVLWDGRDRDGSILANGVYLYKVIVTTSDGRLGSEALGKMAVLK